jgi:SulP family sulfate permease
MASIFSGIFVLVAMIAVAPLAAFVPRTALAGVLIVTAYSMIDRKEILRIWRGARADAAIMAVTFLGTLFLPLEFAVLTGILLSFAVYIVKTSVPEVFPVLPDQEFRHFTQQPRKEPCPQLAILDIYGDLYFGAVSHIEEAIGEHLDENPEQRFVLLRMHSVDQCDFSGIHGMEGIVRSCRDRGGDLFMVRVHESILSLMQSTGFYEHLGVDHFLAEDEAIPYLFNKVLDPAICVYECDVQVFKECQSLPRRTYSVDMPCHTAIPAGSVAGVSPEELWRDLCSDSPPMVVDVREPREFERGHIPDARLVPLPDLLAETHELPRDRLLVLVCRGGRRSTRVACWLGSRGYDQVAVLQGGLLAWEAANLLEAVDRCQE